MIGYKGFKKGLINNYDKQFEVGKTYSVEGEIAFGLTGNGYHFSQNIYDVFKYIYPKGEIEVALVSTNDKGKDLINSEDDYYGYYDLYCCRNLKIERIISREEVIDLILKSPKEGIIKFISSEDMSIEECKKFLSFDSDIIKAIKYFQLGDKDVYEREYKKRYKQGNYMNSIAEGLFKDGKLLARAMDAGKLRKGNDEYYYDFSIWAEEYELAKGEGLYSLSTTLLLEDERIPTYKNMGFLIDSDIVDIKHVCENDCASSGNDKDGDFNALAPNLYSLNNLENVVRSKHEGIMNEVNINMKDNGYVGLFVNKCISKIPLGQIILAQKYFELHSGKELPIYVYDTMNGKLDSLDMTLEEKKSYIRDLVDQGLIRSSKVSFYTKDGEYIEEDYLSSHILK